MALIKDRNYASLCVNIDQARFITLVESAIPLLVEYNKKVDLSQSKAGPKPGYSYQDFVITIKMSHDKSIKEVYRNRTGTLVYALINGNVSSVNHEFIFIEDHIQALLKEKNG